MSIISSVMLVILMGCSFFFWFFSTSSVSRNTFLFSSGSGPLLHFVFPSLSLTFSVSILSTPAPSARSLLPLTNVALGILLKFTSNFRCLGEIWWSLFRNLCDHRLFVIQALDFAAHAHALDLYFAFFVYSHFFMEFMTVNLV